MQETPFYGKEISREDEQELIEALLAKHKDREVNDDLLKDIYEELSLAKHEGKISIPFTVSIKKDPRGPNSSYVEVLLDSKV